jgi:double-strand break repair protein MRE11
VSLWQKMEILPISELGLALHKFVSKDDKLAFTECLQENLDDTQVYEEIHHVCV